MKKLLVLVFATVLSLVTANAQKDVFKVFEKKSVWFMIHEQYGRYKIIMYYDNEYNHSNGEDL